MRWTRKISVVFGVSVLAMVIVSPSHATFPGENGKIAFNSDRDGNYEVYVMNADGSGQANLTNNAAADFQPSWSPDGTQIAFASTRDGNYEVYVMNADGSGQANLTNNAAIDFYPTGRPTARRSRSRPPVTGTTRST